MLFVQSIVIISNQRQIYCAQFLVMSKHSASLKLLNITYFHNKEGSLMSHKISLGAFLVNFLIPCRKKKEKYIYKTNPRTERHEYNPLILWVEFLYCAKKIRNFAEKFISSTTPSLNIASIKNLFMTTGSMSRFLYFYKQDCKYLSISLSLSIYLPNYAHAKMLYL